MSPTEILFTQYLRPNGRRVPVLIERDVNTASMAQRMIAHGYQFDIEELQGGAVAMYVSPPKGAKNDMPLAMGVCTNGPLVGQTVDKLVNEAWPVFVRRVQLREAGEEE